MGAVAAISAWSSCCQTPFAQTNTKHMLLPFVAAIASGKTTNGRRLVLNYLDHIEACLDMNEPAMPYLQSDLSVNDASRLMSN